MVAVLSFLLVPYAIVSNSVCLEYIETIERLDAISARAIEGHMASGKTPRIMACGHWLSLIFGIIKYNSGIIGK